MLFFLLFRTAHGMLGVVHHGGHRMDGMMGLHHMMRSEHFFSCSHEYAAWRMNVLLDGWSVVNRLERAAQVG